MQTQSERESWASRLGFIFAAVGSAVGLANIWKFPYTVGKSGGGAFILLYLICLFLIGFPVFISEVLIGRAAHSSPVGALRRLGRAKRWAWAGGLMVLTGFIVSAFYSAVAAWILGYLVEALRGQLSGFSHPADVAEHYAALMANPIWGLSFHFLFLGSCVLVLMTGVQHGIERGNKIMMPLLIFVLFALVLKGLSLPNASEGLKFLFAPDWSVVTAPVVLAALGQSFFTLSVGQGTMITYGSYLNRETNIPVSCYPIALIDTAISLLSAVVVFTVVFSVGLEPTAGEGLLFNTLPIVFSQLPGGYLMAVFFFLLVTLAALTSEISAMEPLIAYLMDEWGWSRRAAVLLCGAAAFALGVPCALSSSLLVDVQIMGRSILGFLAFWATDVFVPIGGLLAVLLVGWRWGLGDAMQQLKRGAGTLFERRPWLETYFRVCIKYLAPCLIVLVFAHELGWI